MAYTRCYAQLLKLNMKKRINILSLFDGMSTLQLAMKNQGIPVGKYYASEIKPYAIKLTNAHFPDTIQLGDIRNWRDWDIDWGSIDFVGSGSPCQDLSRAGKRKGLSGERSGLFWVFVEILNHIRKFNHDVKFLQENVVTADKRDTGIISEALGVLPQLIDSRCYVPQQRKRLYWSNIRTEKIGLFGYKKTAIRLEKCKKPNLQEILTSGQAPKRYTPTLTERYIKANNYKDKTKLRHRLLIRSQPYVIERGKLRLLNQTELEKLQGFPDDYTKILTYKEAGSLLGDAWTLPVIEQFIKEYKQKNILQKKIIID